MIPVFYTPKMVVQMNASFSPSAGKPAAVVSSWQRLGLPLRIVEPAPATFDDFAMAHDAAHVSGVLSGAKANGFGNRSPEIAASLQYTTGSMLSAARHVLVQGGVAAAPCSGFHHADYSSVAGFCTFNGLMVTAAVLHHEGAKRIGILDCDMHYGDGTEQIIERLHARDWVRHFTAGKRYVLRRHAVPFLRRLPEICSAMRDCDVVLYQAGADPHVDDPLGGWLTTAQLKRRDKIVFETLDNLGVPVAWNLAGGYQKESALLEIHDNTMQACADAMGVL